MVSRAGTSFRTRMSSVYGSQSFRRLTNLVHLGIGVRLDKDGEALTESDNEHHFRTVESSALIAMTTDSIVDQYSRIIFPCSFFIFNVVYWTVYLNERTNLNEAEVHHHCS